MREKMKKFFAALMALVMVIGIMPVSAFAAETDATLQASLAEAKSYIDGITINNSSNDPATVVKTFKKHFTWDNEKRENSKSYLFDWSYYNGVVFEGLEYIYEVTGESVYKDYVMEYMSSLITSSGGWANCTNSGYTSKQAAGYNSTHGADCYKTASLLMDAYEMSGDSRYLTMAKTLYADLDSAASKYSLSNAGKNYRHTWASDPSPDLWLDGLYMILPFRAEYAKHIGDTEELDLIVSRMQWVSDNMYNSSKKLFYHAADSATSNSGTYWLRSIGWYAAAIVDIMDSMSGSNLEAMKAQLVKLVDGMKACQNASNGMWLNNMNASLSSSNPYETSGTALVCYAVMKAVNNGWLDKSYADMAILAFNGICNEKLSGSNLTDICFKGAPGSSNSTFYDNEGKGLGPFIMFYAEVLEYVNNNSCDHAYACVTKEATCVEAGENVYTCTLCGDSYTEEIPATGIHNYESVTVDATETTDGSITYTCSSCKDSYVEVIPATGDTIYSLDVQTGTVPQNAPASASTGAQVVITAPTGKQSYADVTLGMVSRNGNAVSTSATGTLTGLTVTYEGTVVSTEFTLVIEPEWIAVTNEDKGEAVITQNVGAVSSGSYYLLRNRTANKYLTGTAGGNRLNFGTANTEYWYVTQAGGNTYYIQYGGPDGKYLTIGNDSAQLVNTATGITLTYVNTDNTYFWDIQLGNQHLNNYRKEANYASGWTGPAADDDGSCWYLDQVTFGSKVGGYARLMGETNQFCVTANAVSESDVLSKISVQTSADGISADSTQVTVTASMISWDKAFNGTSAGTYVGTVSYEGTVLGTVTVTVTLEHSYETVTVEATCTEAGSITTTCTVCGDSSVETIAALGHTYDCVETEATCGQEGTKVYTCSTCGDTYTETLPATGAHSYETVTVDATCGKDGSKVHTCSVCADTYSETIPATGNHSYASVKEEPTCVTAGSEVFTCTVCGDSYSETIPATGKHIYKSETVAATCVTDGSVTYTCAFCPDSYAETIKAPGHNYTCTVTGATCTEDGSSVYTCSVCGDSYTEIIPAIGHNYTGVVTEATCLKGGFTTFTCANCGDSYVADYTDARGHSYETATVEATCTTDGSTTYYCGCGDSYTEIIPATGHNHTSVVTAPTCTEGGYTTYTCTKCGDSYVADERAALGHSYETVTVEATCTAGGYTTSTCSTCGDSYIDQQTEALGHDYVSVTVEPTETEGGYTTHTCSACGHSYTDNYVDALGHTIVSVVTDPTCENEGYTTHTCTVCGEVTVDNYVPALGHNYQTVTVEATCVSDGSVSGTCTNCGDTYENVTAAYGHNYQATVTAATCTEGGHTVYSCDRCGDNYVADYTDALGHSYSEIVTDVTCTQDGYTTYLCVSCGDSYIGETVAATGHNYESVTAEATCTQDGSVTYTCTVCGDSYAEVISATGHDYEAAVTEPTCTEAGYTTYTCVCGDSYIGDETLALGHSYTSEELDGNLVYTCDNCGDTYTVTTGWIAMSGTYVLDTDGIETGVDNKYIVVGSNKNYALTLSGSTIGASAVTVSDNAITLDDASKYEFYFVDNSSKEKGSYLLTQNGTKGVYHMGGNMYYGTDNKGYWHIGTGSNGAYQLYDYDNLNWYLNYGYVWASDSVSRFAVSSNARSVRLFKAADTYVRLYGSLNQTWAHGAEVTESAILQKVQLQTSMDGITVDGTEAITASMITWDKTLDGYTAGTYTATVTYNGQELGTITVIVTGEHAYKSVTTEATCTAAGSTVYTCTDCGYSYTGNQTAALGHSYTSAESNGYMVYTCSRCGDSYSEKIASTYTKVTAFSSGKNYVITLVSGSKYYALSHANNKISAVQVTVSNGQITSEISDNLLWTYSGNKLSYKSGNTTYYLYTSASNNWWGNWWGSSSVTLGVSTSSSSTVSLTSNKVKVGSYYLRYSSSTISANSSGTTANLFVEG